jgi:acetyl esterase/lipase
MSVVYLVISFSLFCTSLWPASVSAAERTSTVIKEIPYPGATKGDRRRSLDLYLPAKSEHRPPMMIFVHGGFWVLSDDDYRIGPAIAETLSREGVAVALLRYRLAPEVFSYQSQLEDVAAGVALVLREAQRYGYDNSRIFISGHSAGGHLAAMVALDASYLVKHQASPQSLAGVVSFSGLYDLSPKHSISEHQRLAIEKTFGRDPAVLKQASPVSHVRAGAPPFLILTAQSDFSGFLPMPNAFRMSLAAPVIRASSVGSFRNATTLL